MASSDAPTKDTEIAKSQNLAKNELSTNGLTEKDLDPLFTKHEFDETSKEKLKSMLQKRTMHLSASEYEKGTSIQLKDLDLEKYPPDTPVKTILMDRYKEMYGEEPPENTSWYLFTPVEPDEKGHLDIPKDALLAVVDSDSDSETDPPIKTNQNTVEPKPSN